MPIVYKTLLSGLRKTILFFILTLGFLDCKAQGLLFNSNDSLLTKRTSLQLFRSEVPLFQDRLLINFDLSLWDNAHLGYVFNLADRDNSYSLSYLYMDGAGYLNFNIDRQSNKITIPLQASMLRKGKWIKVKIDLDLKKDKVSIYINGIAYTADKFGFKGQIPGNLVFGKNQYYTEVPNMAIKNLTVGDGNKNYSFLLDEWKGTQVHDQEGEVTGVVENPVWLINESYFWKPVYQQSFKDVAGLNFNTNDQNLFIFKRDSLITFDSELKRATVTAYKNKLPVSMVLGKSIFNAKENKCYIYELFDIPKGAASVAALNMDRNNLQWEVLGKTILPKQRHHHNIFYNLQQDTFYMFGGYGGYKYYNTFLRYNATKDNWENVTFKGDVITPRFFAATGNADRPDELFLFGGYGNESGNQIVGGKQFYDLYRINLKDHVVKKCWAIHPQGKEVFVPANNLILSGDKKYFYALCYPHEIAKTEIKLYKFSIKDGSYEVVSAPIPVTSERIESDINLFFNHKTNEFYCTVQEFTDRINSTIKIFSLLATPVSNASYLRSLNPQKKSRSPWIYIGIPVIVLLLAAGVILLIYKRRPNGILHEPENDAVLLTGKNKLEKKKNTIYLLGEFLAFDKNGKDITYLFSPKIKQLFILILLHSRGGHGVTSKKISSTLWPEKDLAKTKNIKGVTFNHLRSIISDIKGIKLSFENDNYLFKINDDFFCDYFVITDLIKENQANNDKTILEHFDMVSRGKFLEDMPDQWLDDLKNDYEEQLINVLQPGLKQHYEAGDLKLVLDLTKLILNIAPFNDKALKYQLKALSKLKGIDYARRAYEQFTVEYKKSFGTEYNNSFEKVIQ
jgi:DNA-binding SARP family transcriptional activator